jgi:hypothetical protein
MTIQLPQLANAAPRHIVPEDFRSFAHAELAVSAPWSQGLCFLPECGRAFTPRRGWQIYCCDDCASKGRAELRRWGHRLALSSLIWRMGKYEQHDTGVRDLTRMARKHVTRVQSAWLSDRHARGEERVKK